MDRGQGRHITCWEACAWRTEGLSCWSTLMATVTVSGSWGGAGTAPHPPKGAHNPPTMVTRSHPLETPPGTGRSTALQGGWLRDILEPRSLLTAGQAHFLLSYNHRHPPPNPAPAIWGFFHHSQALGRPSGSAEDAIISLLGTGACKGGADGFSPRMLSEAFGAGNLQSTPDAAGQWGLIGRGWEGPAAAASEPGKAGALQEDLTGPVAARFHSIALNKSAEPAAPGTGRAGGWGETGGRRQGSHENSATH